MPGGLSGIVLFVLRHVGRPSILRRSLSAASARRSSSFSTVEIPRR